jgi:uncharacterized membrane protein YadS
MPAAPAPSRLPLLLPGLGLSLGVTLLAMALQEAEHALLGGRWIESLVLAILIGVAVRSAIPLGPAFLP